MGWADVADDACTERTSEQALTRRTGGRADGRTGRKGHGQGRNLERVRIVERTGGWGPRGTDTWTGRRGAEGAQHARTGGQADKQSGGRAV